MFQCWVWLRVGGSDWNEHCVWLTNGGCNSIRDITISYAFSWGPFSASFKTSFKGRGSLTKEWHCDVKCGSNWALHVICLSNRGWESLFGTFLVWG